MKWHENHWKDLNGLNLNEKSWGLMENLEDDLKETALKSWSSERNKRNLVLDLTSPSLNQILNYAPCILKSALSKFQWIWHDLGTAEFC